MLQGETAGQGRLTTHVLDTMHGRPAAAVKIELWRIVLEPRLPGSLMASVRHYDRIKIVQTNADGRTDEPILADGKLTTGFYRLLFDIAGYFRQQGVELPQPAFLNDIVIQFGVADADQHYHVPLLVSPYAYSTYRGS